jgi:membrane associated rhomboid family serine protease
MYRITDVVKHLLIINVLMFVGTQLIWTAPVEAGALITEQTTDLSLWGRYQLAMFFPASEYFRPFQIVTHMFMHADLTHLFFNMFALFMFGPPLETIWGPKRFLLFYFITAVGALGLHLLVTYFEYVSSGGSLGILNTPMLGASGAVFGLLAGFGMMFPNSQLMLLFPPIPIRAKYFVLIYAAIELFLGVRGFNTGVAHFAHIGGALFGVLMILYWRYNSRQ